MKASVKQSKQHTLDNLLYQFNIQRPVSSKPLKAIIINQITSAIKEDELTLIAEFTLVPSKLSFSRINIDSFFDEHLLNSATIAIPQSKLLNNNSNFPLALDMKGVEAGNYLIRVEMYEPWSTGEKLCFTSKQIVIDYRPITRESRLVKVPTVKSVAGNDLTVVSDSERALFHELELDDKKEVVGKRDEW